MGQGRHAANLLWATLLIVTAIQGITPDAYDMGSARVFTLLGAASERHWPQEDGDDASDPVCATIPLRSSHVNCHDPNRRTDLVPLYGIAVGKSRRDGTGRFRLCACGAHDADRLTDLLCRRLC
jgi:hypothetical protein